jgi:hypothetical protein
MIKQCVPQGLCADIVQAITNGVLWGVDRASFREVMVACTAAKRERFESTLLEMPLFSTLSAEQRAVIAVRF